MPRQKKTPSISWSSTSSCSSSSTSSSSNFICVRNNQIEEKKISLPLAEVKKPVVPVVPTLSAAPVLPIVPTSTTPVQITLPTEPPCVGPEFKRILAFAQRVADPAAASNLPQSEKPVPLYIPVSIDVLRRLQAPGSNRVAVLIPLE